MIKAKIPMTWFLMVLSWSCGQNRKTANQNDEDAQGRDLISLPFNLTSTSTGLLDLRAADGYSIKVEGCNSGYSGTSNEATRDVKVYRGDSNCLAKLESITLDGTVYQPAFGSGFQTWQPGDIATFQKVGSAETSLRVLVRSQLSSPVLTSDVISYSFSEIKKRDPNQIPEPTIAEAHSVTIDGELAPQFQIQLSSFKGINSKGGGLFEFTLQCNQMQIGSDLQSSCGGALNKEIDYKLVEDTFAGNLEYKDALKLFATPGTFVQGADNHAPGTLSKNGGFKTTGPLSGPDELHKKPKMILVLRRGGVSFTYFNISIPTITPQ